MLFFVHKKKLLLFVKYNFNKMRYLPLLVVLFLKSSTINAQIAWLNLDTGINDNLTGVVFLQSNGLILILVLHFLIIFMCCLIQQQGNLVSNCIVLLKTL